MFDLLTGAAAQPTQPQALVLPPCTLASEEGQTRARAVVDAGDHYGAVKQVWSVQSGRTLCAYATSAVLVSSLKVPLPRSKDDPSVVTDAQLLDDCASAGVGPAKEDVLVSGATLAQFGEVITHAVKCHLGNPDRPGESAGTASLRLTTVNTKAEGSAKTAISEALADPYCRVAVNYHMSTAGQEPWGGHFSPLVAHHAESDSFLIMDVWPDTEPTWICWPSLWASLLHQDDKSGQSRGFAVLRVEPHN